MSPYEPPAITPLGTIAESTLVASALCKKLGDSDEFGNGIHTEPGECP